MWKCALASLVIACTATGAHAQCHRYDVDDDEDCDLPYKEPYARWSVVPEVSALAGWGPRGGPRSVLGAELRLRDNRPWDQDPSELNTVGLGVETFHLATVEPYVMVGHDEIDGWCWSCERAKLFGAAHMAIGAGAAWSSKHRGEPFVIARITFGLMFARPAGEYLDDVVEPEHSDNDVRGDDSRPRRGLGRATRFRFTSQIDLVLDTVVAADGDWRFSMGISIDPFRIIQDSLALVRR
jgi:hypothetical protein